jgi:hypothetical protein
MDMKMGETHIDEKVRKIYTCPVQSNTIAGTYHHPLLASPAVHKVESHMWLWLVSLVRVSVLKQNSGTPERGKRTEPPGWIKNKYSHGTDKVKVVIINSVLRSLS